MAGSRTQAKDVTQFVIDDAGVPRQLNVRFNPDFALFPFPANMNMQAFFPILFLSFLRSFGGQSKCRIWGHGACD
jgi:hypothetical protein